MAEEFFIHLYDGGMDLNDFDAQWYTQNESLFCSRCHYLKHPTSKIDITIDGTIRNRQDMFGAGGVLSPKLISNRLLEALGCADEFMHMGRVHGMVRGQRVELAYKACTPKYPELILRGENPSIFMGKPVAAADRVSVCPACGHTGRRERSPWFLLASERPKNPVGFTALGILLSQTVFDRIECLKLKAVRVQRVRIV